MAAPTALATQHERPHTSGAQIALPYETYKLANGLQVILSANHRLPVVTVQVLYHVGPANERPGQIGLAHLFEHLMYEGSLHVGEKQYFKILEGVGAQEVNGTTDLDHTKYFETVPSNELETALWLESDRMGFLLDTLDTARLVNQRDVVRNERRQKIEGEPYGIAEVELYHLLFPKDHPYYADVIGSHADIEALQLEDARQFFRNYYPPNNASLAIVGDFDEYKVKEWIKKYFGPLPPGAPVPAIASSTPAIQSERHATITDKVIAPRIYMAWITDPIFTPGDAEATMIAQLIGGAGKSSRLYTSLVTAKNLAQTVSAEQTSLGLGSVFTIQATARPGISLDQLEKAIREEISLLQAQGPTQEEMQRARNVIRAKMLRDLEKDGGEMGVAGRLSSYNHYLGNPGFLPDDMRRFEDAQQFTVQRVARQKLTSQAGVVLYCMPGPKVLADVPRTEAAVSASPANPERAAFLDSQSWRSTHPSAGPAPKLTLPSPLKFTEPSGLTVYLVERHNLPIIAADLLVLSGSEANPAEKPGLAAFTTAMLQEGTTSRSALQIARASDQIGAELTTRSIADWSGVLVSCPSKDADSAFELMADLTLHPAFRAPDVERVRQQETEALAQESANPSRLALQGFYQAVYGPQHPYGYMELGTKASLESITQGDLVSFWKSGYKPTRTVLAITGDLNEASARALVRKYFGAWQDSLNASPAPARSWPIPQRRVVIIDRPGAPQTALIVGGTGVPRSSPDYVPLELANTMLGGLVSARLSMNLREQHGFTYGVFSQFVYRRQPGPFFVRTSVRTDVTAPALKEVLNELDGIKTKPLQPVELATAKASMIQSLPEMFGTTQQTSRSMGNLFIYGLALDYYSRLPERIESVGSAETSRAADKYIHPETMLILAVGDRNKIEASLQKMDVGHIEIWSETRKPEH